MVGVRILGASFLFTAPSNFALLYLSLMAGDRLPYEAFWTAVAKQIPFLPLSLMAGICLPARLSGILVHAYSQFCLSCQVFQGFWFSSQISFSVFSFLAEVCTWQSFCFLEPKRFPFLLCLWWSPLAWYTFWVPWDKNISIPFTVFEIRGPLTWWYICSGTKQIPLSFLPLMGSAYLMSLSGHPAPSRFPFVLSLISGLQPINWQLIVGSWLHAYSHSGCLIAGILLLGKEIGADGAEQFLTCLDPVGVSFPGEVFFVRCIMQIHFLIFFLIF